MRALALAAILVARLAAADDAPRNVVLTPSEAVTAAKRLTSCEAKVAAYEASPPVPVVVVVAVVAALVGVSLGAGITYAVTRPK